MLMCIHAITVVMHCLSVECNMLNLCFEISDQLCSICKITFCGTENVAVL